MQDENVRDIAYRLYNDNVLVFVVSPLQSRLRPGYDTVGDPGNAVEIDNGYPYNNIAYDKGLWDNGIVADCAWLLIITISFNRILFS